eukprot:TRINITY_DN2534_c1_g1_i2.p2 TRINITY_DN2534_c1_g1~~TRINITY_DN2534_c1_g1_i2.p2  ORF type:complete len:186 (+),score=60.35 TRINITY_DN2534_c1_g1_i2:656-1213(+)
MTQKVTQLETEKERLLKENSRKDMSITELNRRIETVTHSLELLALENVELKQLIPADEMENVFEAMFDEMADNESGNSLDVGTVHVLTAKIEELESKLKQTEFLTQSEIEKQQEHVDEIDKYEKKIKKMYKKMNESMKKEAERRLTCEEEIQKLMVRVEELEALVGSQEKNDSSSDQVGESDDEK